MARGETTRFLTRTVQSSVSTPALRPQPRLEVAVGERDAEGERREEGEAAREAEDAPVHITRQSDLRALPKAKRSLCRV